MRLPQYSSVFSRGFWHSAACEFRSLRMLIFASLVVAVEISLGAFFIPVGDNLRIYFTYLVQMSGALIYGPLMALFVGFCSDILGFFIAPSGAFFPGYTLSAMLGGFIYGLYLYRSRVSILRLFLARLTVNMLVNVGLGSLWSAMMFSKGFLYYFASSVVKNTVLLIPELILITLLLRLLLPLFESMGVIPLRSSGAKGIPVI